jgi:hypothetical protein
MELAKSEYDLSTDEDVKPWTSVEFNDS